MSTMTRVVKVGGSLLDLADFPARLSQWLQREGDGRFVLVAGGGPLADVIRRIDRQHQIDDAAAHWLCVDLLDTTARLLSQLLPQAKLLSSFEQLRDSEGDFQERAARVIVFSVREFVRDHEPGVPGPRLSHDWESTSDSIAARLAIGLRAGQLQLLKSCDLPAGIDRNEAARQGLLDGRFPVVAGLMPIRWVNLRSSSTEACELR